MIAWAVSWRWIFQNLQYVLYKDLKICCRCQRLRWWNFPPELLWKMNWKKLKKLQSSYVCPFKFFFASGQEYIGAVWIPRVENMKKKTENKNDTKRVEGYFFFFLLERWRIACNCCYTQHVANLSYAAHSFPFRFFFILFCSPRSFSGPTA